MSSTPGWFPWPLKSPDLNNIKPVWNVQWPGAFIQRSNILLHTVQCLCSSSTKRLRPFCYTASYNIQLSSNQVILSTTCRLHANHTLLLSSEMWKMLCPLQGDLTVTYSHFVVKIKHACAHPRIHHRTQENFHSPNEKSLTCTHPVAIIS